MENAQLHITAEPSAPNSANSTRPTVFTPRQKRLMWALLGAHDFWLAREAVDRVAGASNGPQIIMEIRRKVTGHEHLMMEQVQGVDRDGRACKPGRYKLTDEGRQLVLKALASVNGGAE